MSLYAVRVMEPLRAVLLEHLDIALVALLGFVMRRHKSASMFRGALLALVAAAMIAWYDPTQAKLEAQLSALENPLSATDDLSFDIDDIASLEMMDGDYLSEAPTSRGKGRRLEVIYQEPYTGGPDHVLGPGSLFDDEEEGDVEYEGEDSESGASPKRSVMENAFKLVEEARKRKEEEQRLMKKETALSEEEEALLKEAQELLSAMRKDTESEESEDNKEAVSKGSKIVNPKRKSFSPPSKKDSPQENGKSRHSIENQAAKDSKQPRMIPQAKAAALNGDTSKASSKDSSESGDASDKEDAKDAVSARLISHAKKAKLAVTTQSQRLRKVLDSHKRSSVFLACAILACAAWLQGVRQTLQLRIARDLNLKPSAVHAFVLALSFFFSVPLFLLQSGLFSGESSGMFEDSNSALQRLKLLASPVVPWPQVFIIAAAYGLFLLVLAENANRLPLTTASYASSTTTNASSSGPHGPALSLGTGAYTRNAASANATTTASGPDRAVMRLSSMITSFFAVILASSLVTSTLYFTDLDVSKLSPALAHALAPSTLASIGATHPLLWLGLFLLVPGLSHASGLDGAQLHRIRGSITKWGYKRYDDGKPFDAAMSSAASVKSSLVDVGTSLLSFLALIVEAVQNMIAGSNDKRGTFGHVERKSSAYASSQGDSFLGSIRRIMDHIWSDRNSRRIFLFLTINFSFMFVEVAVGWWTNSLGLLSDAGHMFFDNASLFIGLYASYMAKWKPDHRYNFGYARYEVLAGFANAIFLVFVAGSVVLEAFGRLFDPPHVESENLLLVSCLGLGVNVIGLIFFHDVAHNHSHGDSDCGGHSHSNENMRGVYLHVLADALGSVGVICSSLLIKWKGWYLADPVASIIISGLILASVGPLIAATAAPLLSRSPEHLDDSILHATSQIRQWPQVAQLGPVHTWKHHADMLVASIVVQVRPSVDTQVIRKRIREQFAYIGFHSITVEVSIDQKAEPFVQLSNHEENVLPVWSSLPMHTSPCNHDHDHHGHDHSHGGHGHSHGGHGHSHGGHGHSHGGHGHGHAH